MPKNPHDPIVWITKHGEQLRISQMSDVHINHIINLLEKKKDNLTNDLESNSFGRHFFIQRYQEMISDCKKKIKIFKEERKWRADNNAHI